MRFFIGYDPRQPVAAQVLAHSIWKHASKPVSITRLQLSQLPITRKGLTEFTYSRFLCPYLCDYMGYSLFMDSDMLCRADVWELLTIAQELAAPVCVVKNKIRFEWPSLMVFNNSACRRLSPAYIEDTANTPFKMDWAHEIGALPPAWNHLVGYDAPDPYAKVVHFTQGIPAWSQTCQCEFAQEWQDTHAEMNFTVSFQELMGPSVHIHHMKEPVCRL